MAPLAVVAGAFALLPGRSLAAAPVLAPLHGGTAGGEPHVVVVVLAVAGLWGLIAGLVVAVDRLLGRVTPR